MKRITNQTTDELVSFFVNSALERGHEGLSDPTLANRRFHRMEKIFQEIKRRDKVDIVKFFELFGHPDPIIRLDAAAEALWELNEPTAIPVLEEIEISEKENLLSLTAKYTLSEWRKRQQGKSA